MARKFKFKVYQETGEKIQDGFGKEGRKALKMEVAYGMGGINYATYKQEARGVYIHFSTVELSEGNGFTSEQYMLFDNSTFKILALPLSRITEKQFNRVVNFVREREGLLFDIYSKGDKYKLLDMIQGHFQVQRVPAKA